MKFLNALIWIWQLPQNLIGFILIKVTKATVKGRFIDKKIKDYYIAQKHNYSWAGVSLGNYIVFSDDHEADETSIRHEMGHQKQSWILGPLYLLFIGLPSVCGNLWDRYAHKYWPQEKREVWYYTQFWEMWADYLGKVERF